MARLTATNVQRATDANGDSISGAKRYIYAAGTTSASSVYSDEALTTAQSNPLTSDAGGVFAQSYLADGAYKVVVKDAAGVTVYTEDNLSIGDVNIAGYAVGFSTVSAMLSDDTMSYTAGSGKTVVESGEFVTAGGYRYKIAASGASDHQLTTAGSVKLYVEPMNGNTYAVGAFADTAEDGDISSTLETALEFAFTKRNALITLPRGRYNLNSLVDAAWPSSGTMPPVHKVTIDGSGCILEIPSTNTTGGIKITTYSNRQLVEARNLDIQSDAAIGADGDPTSGIGLHFYSNLRPGDAGWGTTEMSQLVLHNVKVHSTNPATKGRWDSGIIVDGFWFPQVTKCYVATRHPATDVTDPPVYEDGDGYTFLNCFSPEITGCTSLGKWKNNLRIDEDEGFGYEDFSVIGGFYVGGNTGIRITTSSASEQAASVREPGGRVAFAHVNGHRWGIHVGYRRDAAIIGCHVYTTIGTSAYEYTDDALVYLSNCQNVSVEGCKFTEGGHYTTDNDCTRGVHLVNNTTGSWITGNQFNHNGIGIFHNTSGTNYAADNLFTAYDAPDTSGLSSVYVQPSGSLVIQGVSRSITPSIEFGGGNTGVTYSTQSGSYVQNGNIITGFARIVLTAKGSSTGTAVIAAGLPAPKSGASYMGSVVCFNMTQGATHARIGTAGKIELLYRSGADNSVALDNADFSGTDDVAVSFSYEIAQA